MAQADGTIIIDTEINSDGMQAGSKEVESAVRRMASTVNGMGEKAKIALQKQINSFVNLNKQYAQQKQKVKELESELEKLSNQRIESNQYKELSTELSALEEKFQAVEREQAEMLNMGFDINSGGIQKFSKDLDKIWADMERVQVKRKEMLASGTAYNDPTSSSKYTATASKLEAANTRLENMNNRLKTSFESIKQKNIEYNATLTKTSGTANKTASSTDKATKSNNRYSRSLNKTKKSANGAQMSMGKMLKMSLLFSLVFRAITAVIAGIKEGFTNLASHSSETNKSISMVWSSLERLKNALATAFAPILNVIAPILSKFIDMLSTAATYVSMFFSSLAGKSTYTKAIAVQKDFAASQKDTADESKDAADALNDAADAAERYMSPLDDINTFTDKSKSGSGSGSGGGSGGGSGSDPMFEEVPLQTLALFEEIKDILSKLFQPFKQSWENEGAKTIAAAKFALESVLTLLKSIGKSMLEVWSNGTGVEILDTMQRIIQNIFYIIGNIGERLNEAWNKNEVGTRIIQKIADICLIILGFLERITRATAEWAKELDFTPLLESIHTLLSAIEPLTQNVFDGLAWFYDEVLLPLGTWTINTAVPTFLDMLSAAIDVVNAVIEALKPLAEWLWNSFLEPLANWTGEVIIAALKAITDLLLKFSNWISENHPLVETFAIIVGSFAAAWGLVNAAAVIWNAVGAIATGVTTAFAAAVGFLTSPIVIAVLAIGALIAVGVLLYKHWDEISAFILGLWENLKLKASEIWGKIKKTFEDFSAFLKGVFEKDWSESFGFAGELLNVFLKSVSEFWGGIKKIFNGLIDFIAGVFTGDWKRAWEGVKSIFEGIWESLASLIKLPINMIIAAINGLVSGVVSGINAVIGALNSINFTIPSWIPFFGGKNFGFNLGRITAPRIPYLASGAVIPPNAPFMAVLGEQKNGTNIETPLATMIDAFNKALDNRGSSSGGNVNVKAEVRGRTLFEIVLEEARSRQGQTGNNPFDLA